MRHKANYETDDQAFPAEAYKVAQYGGIAWRVLGWETQPDEDTEWTGIEVRTGQVVARMVGDDRNFTFDPEDVEAIGDLDYCASCGQIGCGHDGRDRTEDGE